MFQFLSIGLKGVGPFKDSTLHIKPGLTTVYGLNQSEGAHSANGNAAGKSFLLSIPSEIVYEDPIIGEKQDRVKEGVRSFSFKNTKGQVVDLTREGTGRLTITVDGKNVTPRSAADRKKLVKKLFNISQEKYNTYIHVDARKPHPLVMGTSVERKRFFTEFFPLGSLDEERKLYAKELLRLKKERAVYAEVREQYLQAKKGLLPQEERMKLKKLIAKYENKLEALLSKQAEAMEVKQALDFVTGAKDEVKIVFDTLSDDTVMTKKLFKQRFKKRVAEYEYDKKIMGQANEWADWKKENDRYQEKLGGLSMRAQKLLHKYGSVKDAIKKIEKSLDGLREQERKWDKLHDKADDIKADLRTYTLKKVDKPKGYAEDTSDIQNLYSTYKHQLEHAEKFSEGKCEYCGSQVKIKDPSTLKKKVKETRELLVACTAYRQYRKDKKEVTSLIAQLDEIKKQKAKLESVPADLAKLEKVHAELKNLPDSPGEYQGKYKGKTLEGVGQVRLRLEHSERAVRAYTFVKPHLKLLERVSSISKEEYKAVQKFLKKDLHDQLTDMQGKVADWKAKLSLHNTQKKTVKKLKYRLSELKDDIDLIEPLKKLVEGFKDQNVKRMAIEALSTLLMKQVNHYAKMVFPEDYKFSFNWTATQVSILVHRRFGKKRSTPTDVRKLSGAESKLFTLILILALMTFVPKKERCSTLILDEPAANFHDETHERFKKLLPIILKIIPSVVIITPKHEEVYAGSRNFTVHKVNGVASIRKGHPSEVLKTLGSHGA